MMGSETDKIIKELLNLFWKDNKKEEGLDESMKRSGFIFDSVDLLEYKFNKVSLKRGRSYVDSPKWLKNKK